MVLWLTEELQQIICIYVEKKIVFLISISQTSDCTQLKIKTLVVIVTQAHVKLSEESCVSVSYQNFFLFRHNN